MRRVLLLLFVLMAINLSYGQKQSPPFGYQTTFSMSGYGPDGFFHPFRIDSSGNLVTSGSPGLTGGINGYVQSYAPVGQDPNGNWQFLKLDSSGNLLVSGSGGGGSGTVSNGTANQIAIYASTGTTVSGDSLLTDSGTTLNYSGAVTGNSFAASNDGVHAGLLTLPGNTTVPASLPTNSWGFIGPNSAAFTSYYLQPTSTPPSGSQVMSCGTPSSNVSACGWATLPAAGNNPMIYTEATTAGATTNSNSGSPVNMFTGFTLLANTLTAGHRIVVSGCWQHTTGTTATTWNLSVGGVAVVQNGGSTALTTLWCAYVTIVAVDATHQQIFSTAQTSAAVTALHASGTINLATNNTINFTQTASGTADVYTAYSLTVDLY